MYVKTVRLVQVRPIMDGMSNVGVYMHSAADEGKAGPNVPEFMPVVNELRER